MKRIIILVMMSLFLISCNNDTCKSDNEAVCAIESISSFEVEENAVVNIGVFNEQFGELLITKYEESFPQYKDMFTYTVIEDEYFEDLSGLDIVQTKLENTPFHFENIIEFDEQFEVILDNDAMSKFSKDINQSGNYFMPFDTQGLLFAYNKTMLEAFNVNLEDLNEDGLPDAIDSFEKIAELAKAWRRDKVLYNDEEITDIFTFPLNDQLSMFGFLENSDYRFIQGVSAEEMDLGDDLLEALEQLKLLGSESWHFDGSSNDDMVWNYEQTLEEQSAPFLLVGNWMFYDFFQSSMAYELVFSKLPTINESDLQTLSSVSGFVLNKDSLYPNAQNEMLKFIKGLEGSLIAIEAGVIPLIDPQLLDDHKDTISLNTIQQIEAYSYSNTTPLQAFLLKPEFRGSDILFEVDFRDVISEVFNQEMTPEDAQSIFVERIDEWMILKGIKVEEDNDELGDDN